MRRLMTCSIAYTYINSWKENCRDEDSHVQGPYTVRFWLKHRKRYWAAALGQNFGPSHFAYCGPTIKKMISADKCPFSRSLRLRSFHSTLSLNPNNILGRPAYMAWFGSCPRHTRGSCSGDRRPRRHNNLARLVRKGAKVCLFVFFINK